MPVARESAARALFGGDGLLGSSGMDRMRDSGRTQADDIAEAIFEAIADPIFVIDFLDDGLAENFRYVNEAACRLLRRPRDELLRMRPGTVDELAESVMDDAYRRLVTEGRATFETLMIASDGARIPVEIHASDARLAGRRVCIAVARSLVTRKEVDAKMREAKKAAEDANRAKSEFLAMMSHEIRTPLHGVIGFASLLDGADLPGRQRETVEGIRDSANLLLALVTDVLDFSRIEAGQLELQPSALDLPQQLRRISASFRLRAERKGLAFHYLEDPALPSRVLADALRIEQVLGNLLGNALKFTEHGSITLKAQVAPLAGTGGWKISFVISDTGTGIREDQLRRLFKPFSQADSSPARHYGGSGLGLVIVKRLCELMGGTVAVQSEFGKGSVFTASLVAPLLETDERGAPESGVSAIEDAIQPLRILVAEDNPLNRKLMFRMMERLGLTVRFAADGREAIEMTKRDGYDLIFMDVSMPGISGIDATKAIRLRERTAGHPASRIIALTAGVSESERKACSDAGMDDFLGKPFTEEGLRAAIRRLQNRRDAA